MKKLVLMMVGLFLISSAYAQDKAALKAQKEAEKEAKATFKKAKEVVDKLMAEVKQHRNGAAPNDDLTMMCLKVS